MPYKDPEQQKQHSKKYWKENKDFYNCLTSEVDKSQSLFIQLKEKQRTPKRRSQRKVYNKKYRVKNKLFLNQCHKEYYKDHSEELKLYWKNYCIINSEKVKECNNKYRANHLEQRREKSRIYSLKNNKIIRAKRREQVYAILGDKCVQCGFNDKRILHIDHINGGGTREAREIGHYNIIKKILKGEQGYQILCPNCNFIKRSIEITFSSKNRNRQRLRNKRTKALMILGNKCVKCGNRDIRVLQIDHINGRGKQENRLLSEDELLNKIISNSKDYQILCANHNWLKRVEKGEIGSLYWEKRRSLPNLL